MNKKTVQLTKMAMLVAVSIVLVAFIHFPIIPAVPFLEYDPADIPIFIGTFAFGPLGGLLLTAVTAVIQGVTVSSGSGLYGILMHFIATGTFVVVAGLIYRNHKSKKRAMLALACGWLAWILIMIAANLVITPLFMGTTVEVVKQMMPMIVLFNLIKPGINSIVTFLVYKRISGYLHKDSLKPGKK